MNNEDLKKLEEAVADLQILRKKIDDLEKGISVLGNCVNLYIDFKEDCSLYNAKKENAAYNLIYRTDSVEFANILRATIIDALRVQHRELKRRFENIEWEFTVTNHETPSSE